MSRCIECGLRSFGCAAQGGLIRLRGKVGQIVDGAGHQRLLILWQCCSRLGQGGYLRLLARLLSEPRDVRDNCLKHSRCGLDLVLMRPDGDYMVSDAIRP
ncbi:hypothetical protein B296_00050929 [Ensete ventricosum]|uniref:Uncharacterized protein n=1 Tax=Ensete ventricosum TaxID=4639 RepID=A0A426YJ86_ENSVE|nr:hypothetical protein B296_00050929 [Ensete ventricosum]